MNPTKERLREALETAWQRGYKAGKQEATEFVEENGWKMSLSKVWRCYMCKQEIEPGARHVTEERSMENFYLCLTRHSNGDEVGFKTPKRKYEARYF